MPATIVKSPKYFYIVAPDGSEGDWADIGDLATVEDEDGKVYACEVTGQGDNLDEDQVYLLKDIRTEVEVQEADPTQAELDGEDETPPEATETTK